MEPGKGVGCHDVARSLSVQPAQTTGSTGFAMFELLAYERFRDTPSVRFFDVTVGTSNARDLVIHSGAWQFYLHPHQEDNLLAASGGRTFYLVNLAWEVPFHIVRLESGGDILRIPPGTFHRSISDPEGSVVLNQAVREVGVSLVREFRVYNSARIPALMAATAIGSPKPLLHGVRPQLQAA